MGIKTILSAKKIILLASGESKAEAIFKTLKGKITPQVPASILQLHNDVTLIIDKDAAKYL
jgi:glucosamine-6-phosphate deaminase